MSNLEARVLEARASFTLLQSVHSLIDLSLPTIEDVETGRYGAMSGDDDLAVLANDITLLRSHVKSLPITLQQVDIDQVTSDADVDRLIEAFDSLLGLFEDSVLDLNIAGADVATPQNAKCVTLFPKLIALHSLQRKLGNKAVEQDGCGADDPETSIDEQSMTRNNTVLLENHMSLLRLGKLTSYINFPPPQKSVEACRYAVESFGKVITDVFPETVGRWNVESRLEEVTDTEIESIREAYAFSQASASLFRSLVGCITCEAEHVARLHLSGFHQRQLEMLLGTGEHDWIPASFTFCATAASEPRFERMCAHMTAAEYHSRTIGGCFNETMVWEDRVLEQALYDLPTENTSPSTLDHFLREPTQPSARTRKLDLLDRKVVEVLLACSLFELYDSPWLQHGFEREKIFVLPKKTINRLGYWRPHISCDLTPPSRQRSLPEDVAALGVLVLELEANRTAGWTDDDEDYDTATRSNKMRLGRILREWKGYLRDPYRVIGSACFLFENLVDSFDHPKVDQSLRRLATLYKCIVAPLYERAVSDFGEIRRLFQGISGLSVPTRQKRATAAKRLVLYDDGESTEPDKKSKYADDLIRTLEDGFLCNIRALRQNSPPIGLAEARRGMQTPERIRIAVLDTGIDPTDPMIKSAMSRIVDKRSWVGLPQRYEDKHGHGTHVTRLLLKMAPTAQIYVAKITDHESVDSEDMSKIAEAIDWAVKKWDVHIISMSFGFEDQNKAIEAAIERAFKADKLMFAAASNEGGNRGRSRPGRSPKVICIHACDGKGNKGDMSPSPLKRKDNFTTLGVAIESRWKKQTVYKSGTSFATPVAAAMAADVLEFANLRCGLQEEYRKLLHKCDGMLAVFQAMSTERDGYDYVQPGHLWDGKDDDEVARVIRDTLAES